jgi:hypothetical protein
VHRDVVDACIFLARIETLLPHTKENNSMVDASSKLYKEPNAHCHPTNH